MTESQKTDGSPDNAKTPPADAKSSGTGITITIVVFALIVFGIAWAIHRRSAQASGNAAAGAARAIQPPAPVVVGKIRRRDVPIYLDGLGTVQAFNTVTVRARVDGQLIKVAFTEGQDVHTGDMLAQIDPAPYKASLGQAMARKAQDEAQLANARIDLERETQLLAKKIDSQQMFDTQQALVRQYEAGVNADQAAIDSAQVQLDYTTIHSPIDGRTGIRLVDQGNIVHASDTNGLVSITQVRPVSVVFTLPEQNLGKIHDQMGADSLTVLAVDRDNSTQLGDGKLTVIDNQIDASTGTIKIKATFPNTDLRLWPGQFVNVRLLLTTRKDGLVVPASVVQRGPEGAYAFLVEGEGTNLTVKQQTITVAQIEGGEALVDTGLEAGQTVVVDGQYKLQNGSKVVPAQSGGPRGGKPATAEADEPVNVSEPFIRRPIATSLLMAGVIIMGLLGYFLLPISALPPVDFPTIQVTAQYPGASPDVMASSITTPLEVQFGQISGLSQMTSISSFGNSSITLQFVLDRDIDAAAQDVQAAMNAAGGYLPKTPTPPTYSKVNPADSPILSLEITSDTLPLEKVNDLADTVLAQKLSEVTGVGLVTIEGNQKPAVRVRVDPARLASLGLGMEDIRVALLANNINQPKGSFDGPRQSIAIGANDQIFSAAEYARVIVAYKNGSPVRLGDVGAVIDNVENVRLAGWVDNQPAVILDIQRQPGANIIQTADRVKALLPRLRASIPPSVKVSILTDRTSTIRASISDVQFTLLLTVALVVMVIFVFLRKFWATVIPSVALPLAIIGTFGVMKLIGFSLDNLSLMALTIATGFVVDDAIVMIENIVRYIEAGEAPMQAALKGSKQIGFTVISLSFSLIAVFIPLLFMTGIVGRLFREFAITLSVSVAVSAVVSLTLTPMMCSRFLRPESESRHGPLYRATERMFQGMLGAYERGLQWVLKHQPLVLGVAVVTLVATIWLYVIIPKGLLPQQDTGLITGVTDAAQSISFSAMVERQRVIADIVRKDPDVVSVASFVGGGTLNATVNSGKLYINLKPRDRRKAGAGEIIARIRETTKNIEGISLFMQAVQDVQIDSRVSRTQYQYTLEDADQSELADWAPRLLQKLGTLPELTDAASDQQSGGLQLSVDVDRSQASRLNILPQAIDDTLYDAFGQRQVSTIFTQLNQYRVVLEAAPRYQLSPSELDKIYVKSSTGQMVPLSAFAHLKTLTAPLAINHEGQFPAVTLSFNLAPGSSLGQAVDAIQKAQKEIGLPDTVTTSYSGSAAEFRSSLKSEPFLIAAAIVVIYIVLGVLYESYIHPITILSSLPSAGVGALLALMLTGSELSLVAIIGIILLIGIVQKNAIMMIDFALDAERNEGLPPEKSIYQACLLRFRPIMMTTMAALLGALPLAIQNGTGSELRRPLGISIVGGLLFSQFLTLYTTPVIYLYLDRLGNRFRRRRVEAASVSGLPAAASTVVSEGGL